MGNFRVLIERNNLVGSYDHSLQTVATVYVGTDELCVRAPAKAKGNVLDWLEQLVVTQDSPDGQGWVDSNPVYRALAIKVMQEAIENQMQMDPDTSRSTGLHPDREYYWVQICARGHVRSSTGQLGQRGERCTRCGGELVEKCPSCKALIRGQSVTSSKFELPNFCHSCGKAYPWMEGRLDTALDLLKHDDKLTLEERDELWDLLQYVMSDPKADLVPAKRKLIEIKLGKAAQATRELVLDFLAKVAAETLKG